MNLKIRTHLLGIALVVVSFVLIAIGSVATTSLEQVLADRTTGIALRHHIETDASRSALKSQFLNLAYLIETGQRDRVAVVAEEAQSVLADFREARTAQAKLKLRPDIAAIVGGSDPAVNGFYAKAESALTKMRKGQMIGSVAKSLADDSDKLKPIMESTAASLAAKVKGDMAVAKATISWSWRVLTIGGIAALLLVIGLVLMVSRSIVMPLARMTRTLADIDETTTVELKEASRNDEVGALARGISDFQTALTVAREADTARTKAQEEARQLSAERERERAVEAEQRLELQRQSEAQRQAELRKMADDLQASVGTMVHSLRTTAGSLKQAAQGMAQQTSSAGADVTQLGTAAATTEDEAGLVSQAIAELATAASEIRNRTQASAVGSRKATEDTKHAVARMDVLNDAVAQIGNISDMISKIAGQTRLLSLNASIEATRSADGEHGFGVVAQEVKALAARTTSAISEIDQHIAKVRAVGSDLTGTIGNVSTVVSDLHESALSVATAIEQQTGATIEIESSAARAAHSVGEVRTGVSRVLATLQRTSETAQTVNEAAKELDERSHHLDDQMNAFIEKLRAAA
jgi:methyl-accepting chemotaxis protein